MAWSGRSNREIGLQVSRPPNFTAVKAGLSSYAFVLLAILRVFSREKERGREEERKPSSLSLFFFPHNGNKEIPYRLFVRSLALIVFVKRKFEELSLEFSLETGEGVTDEISREKQIWSVGRPFNNSEICRRDRSFIHVLLHRFSPL